MSWARRPITTAPVVRISSCNISVLRKASRSGYRRLTSPLRSFINQSSDMVAPTITFPIKTSFLKERKELLQPYCALLSVYLNATEKTSSLLLLSSGCSLLLSKQGQSHHQRWVGQTRWVQHEIGIAKNMTVAYDKRACAFANQQLLADVDTLLLTQLLLIQNHFQTLVNIQ